MVNPVTVNVGIIVPLTGADVDTWGEDDVNPNMVAIDGLIAGVQTVAVTGAPVTLTSPAGFVPTPSAGPTQSQNRILRFTGTMAANTIVTLPLPGSYIIQNSTEGNPSLILRAVGVGKVVATMRSMIQEVFCDGTDVWLVGLGAPAKLEFWAGISTMPAWVTDCTYDPYLLCDGTVYNFSDFPTIATRLAGTFGGNGVTTFAVPDLRGRVPLAYDGTGTRITTAGSGLNGQTLGAALDQQSNTLAANQIPSLTSVNPTQMIVVSTDSTIILSNSSSYATVSTPGAGAYSQVNQSTISGHTSRASNSISVAYTNGAQQIVRNVQPSQVAGIWVIKT